MATHHEVRGCVVGLPLLQSTHQRINVQQQLSSGHNERRYCNSVRIFIHLVFSFLIPQRAINVLSGDHWAPHVEEPDISERRPPHRSQPDALPPPFIVFGIEVHQVGDVLRPSNCSWWIRGFNTEHSDVDTQVDR